VILNRLWLQTASLLRLDGSDPQYKIAYQSVDWAKKGRSIKEYTLNVVHTDGSNEKALTNPSNVRMSPQWSPDGTRIIFVADFNGSPEIYVIHSDGGDLRQLTNTANYKETPVWSPDGTKIAFVEHFGLNTEICIIDADGGNKRNSTNHPHEDVGPLWSPDGSKILFISYRNSDSNRDSLGVTSDIFVMEADGSDQRQLTNNPSSDYYPDWSPDGSEILFLSRYRVDRHDRTIATDIFVMNVDGSNKRNITNDFSWDHAARWAPDGKRIVFASNRGGSIDIYIIDKEGNNEQRLTRESINLSPVWSPDGRRIAFTSQRDGNSDIYLMNADGSNQQNVSRKRGDDILPTWSPVRMP
jgi:TolB protein